MIVYCLFNLIVYILFVNLPQLGTGYVTKKVKKPPEQTNFNPARQNRRFTDCQCIQKVRTTYITADVCGQAALCYWEIWNYNDLKLAAKGENYTEEECDRYRVQKYSCLIGYPKPQYPDEQCNMAYGECNKMLSQILYDDCEPIRKARGLPKPEDVDWHVKTNNLNYALAQDENTIHKPRPSADEPTHNSYYTLSCPVLYRFPFFTINLLLQTVDPKVQYDETNALHGVGEMLPKFVREGINNERILNFAALSLDESMINWCGIPRNYICVKTEFDPDGDVCSDEKMKPKKAQCEKEQDAQSTSSSDAQSSSKSSDVEPTESTGEATTKK